MRFLRCRDDDRALPLPGLLYMQGHLPVDRLLTGRLALEDINHGFDLLHDGAAIRLIVEFPSKS